MVGKRRSAMSGASKDTQLVESDSAHVDRPNAVYHIAQMNDPLYELGLGSHPFKSSDVQLLLAPS